MVTGHGPLAVPALLAQAAFGSRQHSLRRPKRGARRGCSFVYAPRRRCCMPEGQAPEKGSVDGKQGAPPVAAGLPPAPAVASFCSAAAVPPLLSPVPRAPSCRSARGRPAADGSAVSGQGALQHDRQNASETAAAPGGGSGGGSSVIPASRSELIGISISRSLALLQDCRLLQAAEGQSLAARVLCRGSAKDGRFWWG